MAINVRLPKVAGPIGWIAAIALWLVGTGSVIDAAVAAPQDATAAGGGPPQAVGSAEPSNEANLGPNGRLSREQQRIAEQYTHLEEVLLRMGELSAATDPRRAALLRKAVEQSKEQSISVRLNQLVELLGKDQLSRALEGQADVDKDLQTLLELLLSENRSKHIESEKARIREYLKSLNRLIKQEKDIQGRTAGGDDPGRLSGEQAQLAEKTAQLAADVKNNEEGKAEGREKDKNRKSDGGAPPGKQGGGNAQPKEAEGTPKEKAGPSPPTPDGQPAEGQPENQRPSEQQGQSPSQQQEQEKQPSADGESPKQESQSPTRQRLEAARQRMKEAEAKLKQAERKGAGEKQEEAIRELEQARAQLEEILRQLREEEIERTLVMLEARFRRMLAMQQEVYEGTVRLDKVPEAERTHNHEIESSRLSGKESQIVVEVDKALLVLHEDGSAAAIAEAAEQLRVDMQQIVQRLAQAKIGKVTQDVEVDVITSLQEIIETMKKAQKEQENKGKRKPRPQQADPQQEPPLVDVLSELKMIRALQMRVNTRTERYSKMIEGEQTENAELVEALKQLAERQERIHRVTRDLQMGKNQ